MDYLCDVQKSLGEQWPFAQHPKRGHLITTLAAMTDGYLTTGQLLPPAGQVVLLFFPVKKIRQCWSGRIWQWSATREVIFDETITLQTRMFLVRNCLRRQVMCSMRGVGSATGRRS